MGRTGIGVLCLWLWIVLQKSLSQPVNVAIGKTYRQSSTDSNHQPSYAANGNTNGSYERGNCIQTAKNGDYAPWWEVDLSRKYPVSLIIIWAQSDYLDQLYPLNITVDGQLCARVYNQRIRRWSLRCATPLYGQVVRLARDYRPGTNSSLKLCEVQIKDCQEKYYKSGASCVKCSSTCVNGQCDPGSGKCHRCDTGYFKFGTTCVPCSSTCSLRRCDPDTAICNSCYDLFYKSGTTCCVRCSSTCLNTRCDANSGVCDSCEVGYYKSGRTCVRCSPICANSLCDPDSGRCYNGTVQPPPKEQDEDMESLVGPVVGAVVGSILGLIVIIVTAAVCWRRKSSSSVKNSSTVEVSSSAPTANLSDSAIVDPDPQPTVGAESSYYISLHGSFYETPQNSNTSTSNGHTERSDPLPSSSAAEPDPQPLSSPTVGAENIYYISLHGSFYEIPQNSNTSTSNGHTERTDPPPSSSAVGSANYYETVENSSDRNENRERQVASIVALFEGRANEDEVQPKNIYDKLHPYANEDGDWKPYTSLSYNPPTSTT